MQLCWKPRGARGIEPETFRRRGQLLSRPPTTGPNRVGVLFCVVGVLCPYPAGAKPLGFWFVLVSRQGLCLSPGSVASIRIEAHEQRSQQGVHADTFCTSSHKCDHMYRTTISRLRLQM